MASSTLLVEATQKSVAGGVRTNLDVLNARDQLVQARRDLTQARLAHLLAAAFEGRVDPELLAAHQHFA